mgnify:CR=1 FL=1
MELTRKQFIETLSADERKCYIRAEFYSVYPILLELWRTPIKYSDEVKTKLDINRFLQNSIICLVPSRLVSQYKSGLVADS